MSAGRPDIPRSLAREVRVEAGHRCAIPTCRATSGLQIHHIVEWSKVTEHAFDNLILLCAICHARVTNGEIDTRSVKAYKSNLGLLVGRYGDLERRVLEQFVRDLELDAVRVDTSHQLLLKYLLDDGLLEYAGPAEGAMVLDISGKEPVNDELGADDHYGPALWKLTPEGETLVRRIREARTLL